MSNIQQKYYTIVSNKGKQAVIKALANKELIDLTTMSVGDGESPIDTNWESLPNEKDKFGITQIKIVDNITLEVTGILSASKGGYMITQAGLYTRDNILFAIAQLPQTAKPVLSDGASKDMTIKFVITIADTSVVNLSIDPNINIITQSHLDEVIDALKKETTTNLATKADKANTYTKTEVNNLVNAKANANAVVTLTGDQTIAGNKTFNGTTTLNGAMISKGANTFSGNNTFNTGQVTFNNNAPISNTAPTNSNHLTTKNYVDNSTGADKVIFMNIADNSNEAEALKGKISTKQVFDEWLRYGTHYTSKYEGVGEVNSPRALEEIKSFTYDSTNDYILSNINSESWIYFLNPTPMDNFTLEIDCTSDKSTDDDLFLINLASIVENGEHFRLDVRRRLQNIASAAAWDICYMWGKNHTNDGKAYTRTYVVLADKNNYVMDVSKEPYRPNGWSEGVWKLKAKRTGKKFEAWTSFMNQTYDNNTYMTWTLPNTKPENIPDKPWEMLQRMCNSKALMGIGNCSQDGKFKIVNQTNVIDMKIYDLSTNTILTKNPTTGVWSSSVMGNNIFPNNTLISSKLNNKLYYCTNGTLKLLISGAGGSGLNGTWKNMTAQRQLNVVYTNDTANSIMVCVSAYDAWGGTTMECFVDDLEVIKNRSIELDSRFGRVSNTFIVPSGSTYKVTGHMGGYLWTELGR
ncbi:phage tail protein [Campylobacter devanensis]|uniref:phage tail protein n=1 Tax=Campylobacter devanensis TaxID=3161138 RepID=UPI000A34D0C5|nr:phage tail protein [Campylobacter sp. P0139]